MEAESIGAQRSGMEHVPESPCLWIPAFAMTPIAWCSTSQAGRDWPQDLFEPGLAHAFEELRHRRRRIGDVFLDPGDGDFRVDFLHVRERSARRLDLSCLRQARDVDAMAAGKPMTLLHGLPAKPDDFGVAAGEIVGSSEAGVE